MFFERLTEDAELRFQDLWLFVLSFGEIPRRPSDPSSSHRKNNVILGPHKVSLAQNWIGENKNFECYVFGQKPEKFFSKFLVEPFQIAESKGPFSRMKVLEEGP